MSQISWEKRASCEQFKSADDWAALLTSPPAFILNIDIYFYLLPVYLFSPAGFLKISWSKREQRLQVLIVSKKRTRRSFWLEQKMREESGKYAWKEKRWFSCLCFFLFVCFTKESVPCKRRRGIFFSCKALCNRSTNKPAINTINKTMFVWWLKTNILKKHKCSLSLYHNCLTINFVLALCAQILCTICCHLPDLWDTHEITWYILLVLYCVLIKLNKYAPKHLKLFRLLSHNVKNSEYIFFLKATFEYYLIVTVDFVFDLHIKLFLFCFLTLYFCGN